MCLICKVVNYLTSTSAPASSNLALISLASSTEMFSLTAPPLSAISLDSFKPNPVISLITLITFTLAAPAFTRLTVTTLGPSLAVSQLATGAATATELGSTPNSSFLASTNSLIYNKFISFNALINSSFVNFAISFSS